MTEQWEVWSKKTINEEWTLNASKPDPESACELADELVSWHEFHAAKVTDRKQMVICMMGGG